MKLKRLLALVVIMVFGLFNANAQILSKAQQERMAAEAYIYTYPLVLMEVTRQQMTNMPLGENPNRGPMNTFAHIPAFPSAEFREVVRPNFDTLYSLAWVDVNSEPMILSVPEVKDRFYMLPMYDMWTDTFAVIGTYGTGTEAGEYALCTPQWKGKLPKGVKRIDVPTPVFWIIGRTQTNGPKDYGYIHKIQNALKLTPLSYYGKVYKAPFKKDKSVDDKTPPLEQVAKMDAKTYFTMAMKLMKKHPSHSTDMVMVSRMERLGLTPENFSYDKLPSTVKSALKRAMKQAPLMMKQYVPQLGNNVNNWQMVTKSIGVYGNDYLQRATIALIGLGANPYDQAVYPLNLGDKNGKIPVGEKKYVMHFSKEQIPPVEAFWSITMYDAKGFPVANKINRFAIGDRDDLKFNKDGSLDIYIQYQSPGKAKASNWLPGPPKGKMGITMRLYAPSDKVISGAWKPPYIEEVK